MIGAQNLTKLKVAEATEKAQTGRAQRAELDVPGALWTRALIEAARPPMGFVLPDLPLDYTGTSRR